MARGPKEEWITNVHGQVNGVKAGMKMLTLLRSPAELGDEQGDRRSHRA